jgi:hypothetical protein
MILSTGGIAYAMNTGDSSDDTQDISSLLNQPEQACASTLDSLHILCTTGKLHQTDISPATIDQVQQILVTHTIQKVMICLHHDNTEKRYRIVPALWAAVYYNQPVVVEGLLASRVDIEETHSNMTPLFLACKHNNLTIAQLLTAHGADVKCRDHNQITPLHYAVKKGYTALSRMLLENGASLNAQDYRGITPSQLLLTKQVH